MYISDIKKISNYRNLSGKTIKFDKEMNFFIGENNVGKTNILELLNIFFSIGKFSESDFKDILQPIEIEIKIIYNEDEIGFWGDNFDIDDSNSITLIAKQDSVDERINYYHNNPNNTKISTTTIRKMNVLYYYAQRMPSKEIDFRKTNGSGKVLNYLIQGSLEKAKINEKEILKTEELNDIIKDINKKIDSMNTITGDKINAYLDDNPDKFICRLLTLGDDNGRDLSSLGEGIQYAFNILLQIIDIIYTVKTTRKLEDFEERLIIKEGKKLFPLILILDEPEIHQHPYRQRSLIKRIKSLMNNENDIFASLLKELFGIDGLIGQIFIATHSPNILLNDYKQFIRVFNISKLDNKEIFIKSGCDIDLDEKLYKHLLRTSMYFKEAMFSKCVLFVEGDTENGAIPVFADRMKLDLDKEGIGIIKLDGADNVESCIKLYNVFGIKTVAILDRDKKEKYKHLKDVFFTEEIDFEEEIYNNITLIDYIKYNYDMGNIEGIIKILKKNEVKFNVKKFISDPSSIEINEEKQIEIKEIIKLKELEMLKGEKNARKGALLAEYVTSIPSSFQNAIKMLKNEVE